MIENIFRHLALTRDAAAPKVLTSAMCDYWLWDSQGFPHWGRQLQLVCLGNFHVCCCHGNQWDNLLVSFNSLHPGDHCQCCGGICMSNPIENNIAFSGFKLPVPHPHFHFWAAAATFQDPVLTIAILMFLLTYLLDVVDKPFSQWQCSFHLKAALPLANSLVSGWDQCSGFNSKSCQCWSESTKKIIHWLLKECAKWFSAHDLNLLISNHRTTWL